MLILDSRFSIVQSNTLPVGKIGTFVNWFANCILVDWLIDRSIDRTNERAKKKKKINKLLSKLKMIILYCKKWQGIPNLNDFFFFFLKGCHNQWLFLQDIFIILIALKFGGKYFCSEHFKKNSNHCRIIQKIYVCFLLK